jgi:hypothetical protein
MGRLLAPLSAAPSDPAAVPVATLGLIVDLLCFCAQHHAFRIKYYSLRNNVGEKVRSSRWPRRAGQQPLRAAPRSPHPGLAAAGPRWRARQAWRSEAAASTAWAAARP